MCSSKLVANNGFYIINGYNFISSDIIKRLQITTFDGSVQTKAVKAI